jgi:alcohol dehydrogenase
MAVLLPYGLEYNMHRNGSFTAELLMPIAGQEVYRSTSPARRTDAVVAVIRKLNNDLHEATGGRHPRCLKEVRDASGRQVVPKEALAEIAKTAQGDGSIFYNPEELDYGDLLMVTEAAWEGTPLDKGRIKKG